MGSTTTAARPNVHAVSGRGDRNIDATNEFFNETVSRKIRLNTALHAINALQFNVLVTAAAKMLRCISYSPPTIALPCAVTRGEHQARERAAAAV